MKIIGSFGEKIADILASEVSNIVSSANKKFVQGLRELAQATIAKADEMASSRLHSTRQQYVDSLKLEKLGPNIYAISLDDDAKHLETGYEAFNMIAHGLTKGPKSKVSKEGYRYVVVPFQNKKNAPPGTPAGDRQIQQTKTVSERGWSAGSSTNSGVAPAVGIHSGTSLAAGIQELEKKSGLSKMVPDVTGRVGTWNSHPANTNKAIFTNASGHQDVVDLDGPFNPLFEGLMKFQNKTGKRMQGSYLTFRVASENPNSRGKWNHPGFQGAKIFPELEGWAMQQLQKLVDEF